MRRFSILQDLTRSCKIFLAMRLDHFYQKTPKIKTSLEQLNVIRRVIDLLPRLPHVEENLRRESLLKSSLFSARIEGNSLKLEEINYTSIEKPTKIIAKMEIANILRALRWLYSNQAPKNLNLKLILRLHELVMANLSPDASRFRHEPSAIFNQAGIAIYMTPPPSQINDLISQLIVKFNTLKEEVPVKAATIHFLFEKIHPFLDGNGRTGRLLSTFILNNAGYGFRGLVSLEEYLENNRQDYYDLLAQNGKDLTGFIEFFLEGLTVQAEKTVNRLKEIKTELPEDSLLPRRREILEIIKDHQTVSFDFLKRRFRAIPSSNLHYDLQKLLKDNFIKKLGQTRGAVYTIKQ